jgi:hypothetical protein
MTICILIALRVLWRYVVRIFAKFQLPQDMVISGRFVVENQNSGAGGETGAGGTDSHVIGRHARPPACARAGPAPHACTRSLPRSLT